ncbi:MAG: DUF3795 domain-containing protein [Bacteroidales bacterium]|nr:DUF3795 domain-containing protein [Bacteroidales bacterium]
MQQLKEKADLVAACGLYCGGCPRHVKGKCPGCFKNEKLTWCKIKTCVIENNYQSCADCTQFENVTDCKKFNNFMNKAFELIFNSNRNLCISKIKEMGYNDYAIFMENKKAVTLKKRGKN